MHRWLEDIQAVRDRDPAARSIFEVILCYPGIHALMIHRFSHALWNHKFFLFARWISSIGRFMTGIEIHPGAQIGRRVFIDHGMGVVIGETTIVGEDCTLYQGVTLGGTSLSPGKRHPTLEAGVVVGAGAKVLGPITIGMDAKIGSNAVVVNSVPASATAVGIPARILSSNRVESKLDKTSESTSSEKPLTPAHPFAAYGTGASMPDPVQQTLQELLDRIEALERK
ncbi:MAG: serine O-acetyltransferase [Pseudomonadota bacterium]